MDDSPAIIIADPRGVIRIWNEGAEKLLGHRADERDGSRMPPTPS